MTPPVRVIDGVTLELTGTGKGGGSEGVRSADGTSLSGTAADNTVEITGSYGDLAGPALVSVVADDADDGDAILGAGDTLTLTFDVSTDRGSGVVGAGLPSLTKAQVDGLLIAPSLGTDYTGEWTSGRTDQLVITVVDPAGHNATMWADGAAGVVVSVRPTAKVYAASGLTLPASGPPTALTGDWGLLPAPSAVTLVAAGDASDAIYGNEDTITLAFDGPTDMGMSTGGAWAGGSGILTGAALDAAVSCSLALGDGVQGYWVDASNLRLKIVDTTNAAAELLSNDVDAGIGSTCCVPAGARAQRGGDVARRLRSALGRVGHCWAVALSFRFDLQRVDTTSGSATRSG